jgi:hypothetical protein
VKAGAAVPTALEEHIPENLGDMPVEIILIELKAEGLLIIRTLD